jgi:hypothetical protein
VANVLTPIIPSVIASFQEVLREAAMLPKLVSTDFGPERVAVGQSITIPIGATMAAYDVTPSATPPSLTDVTVTNTAISITKSRGSRFNLTGEDYKRAAASGPGFRANQITEAIRTLANEVHSDLADLYVDATEAVGTAGTIPFASDTSIIDDSATILTDDLAPLVGRVALFNSEAMGALTKRGELTKVNESGTEEALRNGFIGRLKGFDITMAHVVKKPASGTGSGYLLNGAVTLGASSITVDTGTGTILAGDVVTFAGDTTQYVVATALSANVFTLNRGVKVALADNAAVTVKAASRRNLMFHKTAIGLVARPPAQPDGGDMAVDEAIVTDPISGLSMRLAAYKGYHSAWFEVSLAWGVKTLRKPLLKLLLG